MSDEEAWGDVYDAAADREDDGFARASAAEAGTRWASEGAWIREETRDGYIEHLDGIDWWHAPAPPRRHRCQAQTRAYVDGVYVERCACGAFGPEPFFMIQPDKPRVAPSRSRVASLLRRLTRRSSNGGPLTGHAGHTPTREDTP